MVDLNLTKRQQEIFDFIKRYSAKYGYPPTVRDIGKAIGLTSSSTVHAHLANLEKVGLLRRDPTQAARDRGAGRQGQAGRHARRPARSSARWPRASRCSPRRTSRSTSSARASRAATRASSSCASRGDSMKDAGIHDGDHVVVRAQETAAQRRDRRRARGRGGHGQALLQGERPRPAPAGERRAWSRSARASVDGPRPRGRRAAGGSRERARDAQSASAERRGNRAGPASTLGERQGDACARASAARRVRAARCAASA